MPREQIKGENIKEEENTEEERTEEIKKVNKKKCIIICLLALVLIGVVVFACTQVIKKKTNSLFQFAMEI